MALRAYRPASYPQIEAGLSTYITNEFDKIAASLATILQMLNLREAADDTAAATAGVAIGDLYRTSAGAVKARLT